ncbi:MAG: prepilin-type N-terminal cleavage/methylation domain-containing protein [Candidatus Pacebacteria bacterium]|nr:prepilin-type N-terminal cleavage/methylation domain-containing protein [Candidatus Paceibacterota bacterium]
MLYKNSNSLISEKKRKTSGHLNKVSRGFSLIELLVAIAIMGILSSIILVSLGSARTKARLGRVQSQMSALHPHLIMCINDGYSIDYSATAPAVDASMCVSTTATFPALSVNWVYTTSTAGTYAAIGEGKTVTCSETGCITTDTP